MRHHNRRSKVYAEMAGRIRRGAPAHVNRLTDVRPELQLRRADFDSQLVDLLNG
jgi:hypothetical protein